MTPAEFTILCTARTKTRDDSLIVLDCMNALLCTVIARCAGNDAEPAHFRILQREETKNGTEMPVMGDDPATIRRKLELLALSMGTPVN